MIVDVLAAGFQTKQLGEGMLTCRLGEDEQLVAPDGALVAFHGLLHPLGEEGAEFTTVFTHGRLESLDPIAGKASDAYRCLGRGLLWTRDSW